MRIAWFAVSLLAVSCATAPGSRISSEDPEPEPDATAWSDRLSEPVTQGTTFESPVIQSQVRPFVAHTKLPATSVFQGGDYQLVAVQARYAVTDRLALIATKDGYIDFNPKGGSDESGFADVAFGFKYAVVDDPDLGLLVTPGITFELDVGNHDVFQGNGDGLFHPFVSAGLDLDRLNFVGSVGYSQPVDGEEESSSVDYHFHVDYEVTDKLSPMFEVNGITYTSDGGAVPFNFEGNDLINLGSANVDGNTVVTGALGGRYRFEECSFGVAYEWPLTNRRDLLGNRWTFDFVIPF